MSKRLCLSSIDRKMLGVCGGLAEYFGLEPAIVRIGWVILVLLTKGLFIAIYLVLWAVLPRDDVI